MNLLKLGALLGASLGVAAGSFFVNALPGATGWFLLTGVVVMTIILYAVAAVAVAGANDPAGSGIANFIRYVLIGLNAGLNAAVAGAVFGSVLGAAGWIVGIVLGTLNLASTFEAVSTKDLYQRLLGWANWLLPMSWPIVGLGFLFLAVSALAHFIVYVVGKTEFLRVHGMRADWKTGTFFVRGGFVANLNPLNTAFNMGSFAFVDSKPGRPPLPSPNWHIEHEAGHTLNLAAFGSVFHLIGAIDENVTGGGTRAFSERLAESNDPDTKRAHIVIPMWA